jgi:hypothetical protein
MTRIATAFSAAIAAFALTAAASAGATKPKIVTMPASVLKSPDARICMPRTTSPVVAKDKTLPATLCETVEQWSAHGVTIVSK